jgi:hypothetical protein
MRKQRVCAVVGIVAACAYAPATAAPRTTQGHEATVLLHLKLRHRAQLARVVDQVSDPASPRYGRYLSADEVRSRFAPLPSAVRAVRRWAQTAGLTIVEVPRNRALVAVRGSRVRLEAELAAGPPPAIARFTEAVVGLRTAPALRPAAPPAPAAGLALRPGPCARWWGELTATDLPQAYGTAQPRELCGYTPQQLQSAYGVKRAIEAGIDGRGQTVAVLGVYVSPTLAADLAEYSRRHGLPAANLTVTAPLSSAEGSDDAAAIEGFYGEQTLDVEAVHAIAPGAHILYVGVASGTNNRVQFDVAINDLVANHRADEINISYAVSEFRDEAVDEQVFMQAAAQGIGIYAASGDEGDSVDNPPKGGRTTTFPAASPHVTAVGGTTLAITRSGARLFEIPWGTGRSILKDGRWDPEPPGAYLYGGGGGTSFFFAQPDYQRGVVPDPIAAYNADQSIFPGFFAVPGRAVPDIALDGDPQTGILSGQTLHYPDGPDRYGEYRQAGTSLAAPLMAGLVALADQAAGIRHGFLNPLLYRLVRTPALLDVAAPAQPVAVVRRDFENGVDDSKGIRTSLTTTSQLGTLTAAPGYDDSTGLGAPNGLAFLRALAPASEVLKALEQTEATACRKVLRVRFPRHGHSRIVRAVAYVNGRRKLVRRGHALRSVTVHRPGARAAKVVVIARTVRGGRLRIVRRFRACE